MTNLGGSHDICDSVLYPPQIRRELRIPNNESRHQASRIRLSATQIHTAKLMD